MRSPGSRTSVGGCGLGEWTDPRRGRVPLSDVAADWLNSRSSVKRRTRESDESDWRNYVAASFRQLAGGPITAAEVSAWVGGLMARGLAPATATRALATLRSILAFAVADGRVHHNVAATVRRPTSGRAGGRGRRLPWLSCKRSRRPAGPVPRCRAGAGAGRAALGRTGWSPGRRLGVGAWSWPAVEPRRAGQRRRRRAVRGHAEEQPGPDGAAGAELVPIVDRWSAGKEPHAWLFDAPEGGPLRESNWKRSVGWRAATSAAGVPDFRVHDLRHTAASVWLAAGADPKVVQRVLGHATAAMTMDLYGHLVDANLWQAARLVGDITGALEPSEGAIERGGRPGAGCEMPGSGRFGWSRLSESNR